MNHQQGWPRRRPRTYFLLLQRPAPPIFTSNQTNRLPAAAAIAVLPVALAAALAALGRLTIPVAHDVGGGGLALALIPGDFEGAALV